MTRYEVALNDATPASILEKLIQDIGQCDWRVEEIKFGEVSPYRGFIRWAVIQNQNTPQSTLEKVVAGKLPEIDPNVDSILKTIAKAFLDK
jgi:predicted transcriptional regulator